MTGRGMLTAVILTALMPFVTSIARAQNYNALKECAELSPSLDDIHLCMDNYLDIMDSNISGITEYLADSLSGDALAGLARSQQAFVEYRRQNCLWYLEFSSPRTEAEQIAKNCLASMSQQRFAELQALVAVEDTSGQSQSGYYIYGAGRNTFQLCGSEERYWLEGDASLINRAQQLYLSLATSDSQALYAVFAGELDRDAQAPDEHQGVFRLTTLIDISLSTDADCRVPGNLPNSNFPDSSLSVTDLSSEIELAELQQQEEPQQQLIAYFGAWLVDCTENDGVRVCHLQVDLDDPSNRGEDAVALGVLEVIRQKQQATALELIFPDREIDSPARIRWQVDKMEFGDIIGSEIRVDELTTRQLVPASRFLRSELLPMMIGGTELRIEVLESVDDATGEQFVATLNGLTKALAFSDDFVRDSTQ